MNIHDHGENDPLEFTLGSWAPVAAEAKRAIEEQTGRVLTQLPDNSNG